MLLPRIIPCLLIHKGGLVKTKKFENPKYLGDPINAVKIFNEKEVDELVVLDIDATVNDSEPNYGVISKLASECRMPLCYGGGIKTKEQAKKIISLGVEKIAISSVAICDTSIITEISEELGRQSVVVAIDIQKKRSLLGAQYEICSHNASLAHNLDLISFDCAETSMVYLKDNKPSLLFLDIIMPVKDGFTFLSELRRLELHRDTSVIMITSKDYAQDRTTANELGALEFITKPMPMRAITDIISKYISKI